MPYSCETNENGSVIIINHQLGHKYSFLIKEIARYLLEVAFETKSTFNTTENTVIIELPL